MADSNHSQAHSHNFISGDEMLKASGQLAGIWITGNELSGLKSPQKKMKNCAIMQKLGTFRYIRGLDSFLSACRSNFADRYTVSTRDVKFVPCPNSNFVFKIRILFELSLGKW